MSDLSTLFTGLREFVDQRQDTYIEFRTAANAYENLAATGGGIREFKAVVEEHSLYRSLRDYNNRNHSIARGNNTLRMHLRNVDLSAFKSVIGEDDFV